MQNNGQAKCDFCYADRIDWEAKFDGVTDQNSFLGWKFEVCDSCRLLLRNVIGPVLHRLSHTEIVQALMQAMHAKGITYADLMTQLVEWKVLEDKPKRLVEVCHTADGRHRPWCRGSHCCTCNTNDDI